MSAPDAVFVVKGTTTFDGMAQFKAVLGVDKHWFREVPGGHLVTGHTDDTMLFAKDHARAGEARYTWSAGQNGISYGTLVPGALEARDRTQVSPYPLVILPPVSEPTSA